MTEQQLTQLLCLERAVRHRLATDAYVKGFLAICLGTRAIRGLARHVQQIQEDPAARAAALARELDSIKAAQLAYYVHHYFAPNVSRYSKDARKFPHHTEVCVCCGHGLAQIVASRFDFFNECFRAIDNGNREAYGPLCDWLQERGSALGEVLLLLVRYPGHLRPKYPALQLLAALRQAARKLAFAPAGATP